MESNDSELSVIYKNPDASMDLTLKMIVTTNVPEKQVLENVLENAKNIKKWVKQEEPHGRTLLICGSGPSIKDDLKLIGDLQDDGCDVWALNNCANFLAKSGIIADYQVIMDAQPETISLVGMAFGYLFASQVNPELFKTKPDAVLWHSTYGNLMVDEQDGFPEHEEDYCLIGSSISIGNTVLVLAYAMGYRNIHLFGYDSSHDGDSSHVIRQDINQEDPTTFVYFNGKTYICSLTMKLQVEYFTDRANTLKNLGCNIKVHGYGLLPDMWNTPVEQLTEQEKYTRMWGYDAYRHVSPGEEIVDTFLNIVKPSGKVIDYGCGTGRAAVKISKHCDVVLLDFTTNSRDESALQLPFFQCDLTEPIKFTGDYGICTDVMEHIPPDDVETVIKNILDSSAKVFFQISTVPDSMGIMIGQQLHLTVKDHSWWMELFEKLGYKVELDKYYPSSSQFYIIKE